jgi:hypothetical protein
MGVHGERRLSAKGEVGLSRGMPRATERPPVRPVGRTAKDAKKSEKGLPGGNSGRCLDGAVLCVAAHRRAKCLLPNWTRLGPLLSFASFAEKMLFPKAARRSVTGVPFHA